MGHHQLWILNCSSAQSSPFPTRLSSLSLQIRENISRVTQLINSPDNTCVSLLIPASLNHSVFHLSVLMKLPRLCGVLFLYAAAAAVSSCPWERYSNLFTSLVLFCSAMVPPSFRRRRFLTFTEHVFSIIMKWIIHYCVSFMKDQWWHFALKPRFFCLDPSLCSGFQFSACSLPTRTANTAYKGFGSDGILKAETLPYVAHQREFPEAGPCLISTVSNGIIKLAVCSRNNHHI